MKFSSLFFTAIISGSAIAALAEPDKERHLGPTGMYGVVASEEVTITRVEAGSPADGNVESGDIFTAAGGESFTSGRVRQQLAKAIDESEAIGVLVMTRDDGSEVKLELPVMGSYSDTAPIDCQKTDAIITRTADFLMQSKEFGRRTIPIALLSLLATGEDKYIDFVKDQVHSVRWANPNIQLSIDRYARVTWDWGYTAIFLGEYYLLTQDEYVLPAIREYAIALAKGRDAAGLWGHAMATLDRNRGQLHGRAYGYGIMNQSSLPCFLALLLAEKCGVDHPEVTAAIKQTGTYYESYIGRGTIPYGVHEPNPREFNNNGMSALAATAFALAENREGTEFFARMSAASHNTLETGHTGHYFNQLWTGLGAAFLGPDVSAGYFSHSRWLHTMNRKWNGDFTYDQSGGKKPNYSYRGLTAAGSHLLNHCVGRRVLWITGRGADASLWLTGDAAEDAVEPPHKMAGLSDKRLLELFGHPMPKVRNESAFALRERDHAYLPQLIVMLRQGSANQRAAAFNYFGYHCPPGQAAEARDVLGAILRDTTDDLHARSSAALVLALRKEEAYRYFGDMLRLVIEDKPSDPLQRTNDRVGRALNLVTSNPHADELVKDKELFYAAVRALLKHPRDSGRAAGAKLVAEIPREDLHYVGEHLAHIIADEDLSYHSYHSMVPHAWAISVFAKHRIQEGIEGAFAMMEKETGKYSFKARMFMHVVPKFGAAAKPYLAKLKEMHPGSGRFKEGWDTMIETIESAEGSEEMMRLEEVTSAADVSR